MNDDDIKAVEEVDRPDGIALELLKELKSQNAIADNHNKRLCILVGVLIALFAGVSIYHEYQWSQFETVVVDSKDGGNASYIGRDGDVMNGTSSGTQTESDE